MTTRTVATLLLALLGATMIDSARATVFVDVNPQTVTVGTPVSIFGSSNCEAVTVDFGDGSPMQNLPGPGAYSTVHVYTQPSPSPPGIWLVTVLGISCPDALDTAIISVIVNPGVGGEPVTPGTPLGTLAIQRLDLHFENRRPQIRVEQNHKGLQAFAQIQYSGTGLLQGYWEVDGTVWSFVNRHLVFGSVLTLSSPAMPGLPTVDPGVHRVRFVLIRPTAGYTSPIALYFAGYDEAAVAEPLLLIRPLREARMDYEGSHDAHRFEWSGPSQARSYRVSFFDAENGEVAFSALTQTTGYDLLTTKVEEQFIPGRRYEWQVLAFDGDGAEVGRSVRRAFGLLAPQEYVAGQIVVLTEFSPIGTQTLTRLGSTYGVRQVESYRLESVDLQMTVFETQEDVVVLSRTMALEDGVVLAHPNFILRTLSEPHARLQKVHSALQLDRLHERTRGRHIRVAVIDSGVDVAHTELADRVASNRSFVDGERAAPEIHGTAVAGVISASLNETGIAGIAPETELLALRACSQIRPDHPKARCESAHVARALDAALMERARVVNMSFGSEQPIPLLERLITKGAQSGVLLLAPVGNAKWQKQAAFPARHAAVLAVAGLDEAGAEYPNGALYRASRIVAPATNVFSAVPGNRYNFLSGTSFSSAIAAGLIALTLEQRSVTVAELPAREARLCTWAEQLTGISLCVRAEIVSRVPSDSARTGDEP